ncbi:MAG: LysR family transcriptional regulator [Dinoroseobacter sp.]|nr:LysR family transcriptional regulator [Dinoroseobacter sp.]
MSINHNNLRRLDLNLLLAFDALMRTESVSSAAECLSLGQPAMSHNLRRLRDLFGDELLTREGGRLRPTDRGLALWAPVREALEGLETGLGMARGFNPNAAERVFRISLPDYLAASVLSYLTAKSADAPGVKFRIESLDRDPGRDALIAGQLDAYVGVMPSTDLLVAEPLFEDDFVTLYDPDHWSSPPDTLDPFCAAQHLLVAQIDSFEGWVDVSLADQDRSRQVVASVARFGDAVATLSGTPMLTTLPRKAAANAGSVHGLAWCAPAVGARSFSVNLYRRRRAIGAPASEWLAARIRDSFDQN